MRMSTAEANRLLGGPHSSEDAITAAFRHAARAGATGVGAGYEIGQLQEARDVLVNGLNQGQEIACKMCGGSGRVGVGFGTKCTACKGEGIVNG